ncbi:MAG: FadR family transcriptional regulator [Devosiaceae bacterium]|nr:FadR family transcriptional regulator [Devosiaceae bacterium MH13]
MFKPIVQKKTADTVVERFQSLILDGVLRPGARLPAERQLATDLEVSRPILRDALVRLEADGLIDVRHGEGTYVADVIGSVFSAPVARMMRASKRGMADYMEFRRVVEADMAAMAASRATQTDLDALEALGVAMQAAHDAEDEARERALDIELHTTIVEAAHNLVFLHALRACYRLLEDDVFANRQRIYAQPGERRALLGQHLDLIEAIRSGKPDAARAAAERHIDYIQSASNRLSVDAAREETAALRQALRRSDRQQPSH